MPLQFLILHGFYCLGVRFSTQSLQAALNTYSFSARTGSHETSVLYWPLTHTMVVLSCPGSDQFPQMPVDPITSPPELSVTAPNSLLAMAGATGWAGLLNQLHYHRVSRLSLS